MAGSIKVLISSTSEDLEAYRLAASDVIRAAQWTPRSMESFPTDPQPILKLCYEEVSNCGLVILLVAFRRGWVPTEAQGGDGQSSITVLEIAAADRMKKPILAFFAEDSWPGKLWDRDPPALSAVTNFRDTLNRNATFFQWEDDPKLPRFRALLAQELANYRSRVGGESALPKGNTVPLALRRPDPHRPLPPEAFPLLQPYDDPRTFAGRDHEIDKLEGLVRLPQLLLCLHAPSGAGKSSLLLAGLTPRLRTAGFAVAVERTPGDVGLVQRLVRDLLDPADAIVLRDNDDELPLRFAEYAAHAHSLSGHPVVLILDQIDDILRNERERDAMLARVGPLIAATAQRLPGAQGFACKWLLCYRHEYHGEVRAWLEDVLAPARRLARHGLALLPHDMSDSQKSHDWPVPVMGKPLPGAAAESTSLASFRAAIMQPLTLQEGGHQRYQYVLTDAAVNRIAGAFAQARAEQPMAPLVPELQVVLNHLLQGAWPEQRTPKGAVVVHVDVPEGEQLRSEIDRALEHHLERALQSAFPDAGTSGLRSRALTLIALRQLADAQGQRSQGLVQDELARLLGPGGNQVIARLAAADTRILVAIEGRWALSHDRLAEAVTELYRNQAARGRLQLDQSLIDLQRMVGQKIALHQIDPQDQSSLVLTRRQRALVRANEASLLQDTLSRVWWSASTRYKRQQLMKNLGFSFAFFAVISCIGLLGLTTEWQPQEVANHWFPKEGAEIKYYPDIDGGHTLLTIAQGKARRWDARSGRLIKTYEDIRDFASGMLLVEPLGSEGSYVVDLSSHEMRAVPFRSARLTRSGNVAIQSSLEGPEILETEGASPGIVNRVVAPSEIRFWSPDLQATIGSIKVDWHRLEDFLFNSRFEFYESTGRLLVKDRLRVTLWDLKAGKLLGAHSADAYVVDRKGATAAILDFEYGSAKKIVLWDLRIGRETVHKEILLDMGPSFRAFGEELRMRFSTDGAMLFVGGGARSGPGPILVLDTRDMKPSTVEPLPWITRGLWMDQRGDSRDDDSLLLLGSGTDMYMWTVDGARVKIEGLDASEVERAYSSRDRSAAMVVRSGEAADVWDLLEGTKLRTLERASSSVELSVGDDGFLVHLKNGFTDVHLFKQAHTFAELPTGVLGQNFKIGVDSACSRINAWLSDGRVLQFSKGLRLFGQRLWTYGSCAPGDRSPPTPDARR